MHNNNSMQGNVAPTKAAPPKVALITGGGRGLGEIMAKGLAANGVSVALVSRSLPQLEAVAADIKAQGGNAIALTADVTSKQQIADAIAAAESQLGSIDLLINNAGVDEPFGPIGVIDADQWWHTQSVHVLGPLYTMTALLPAMAERGRGHIINICSLAGRQVVANMSAYAVAKNTEIRLTEHVAAEWADRGIAAFAIEPGTILTSMSQHTLNSPDAQRWIPGGIAFLKSITTEQSDASAIRLVEMVLQLASGDYDGLSGRYLEPGDDFDALLDATLTETQQ